MIEQEPADFFETQFNIIPRWFNLFRTCNSRWNICRHVVTRRNVASCDGIVWQAVIFEICSRRSGEKRSSN